MNETVEFLLRHGYLLLFAFVLKPNNRACPFRPRQCFSRPERSQASAA